MKGDSQEGSANTPIYNPNILPLNNVLHFKIVKKLPFQVILFVLRLRRIILCAAGTFILSLPIQSFIFQKTCIFKKNFIVIFIIFNAFQYS